MMEETLEQEIAGLFQRAVKQKTTPRQTRDKQYMRITGIQHNNRA